MAVGGPSKYSWEI